MAMTVNATFEEPMREKVNVNVKGRSGHPEETGSI